MRSSGSSEVGLPARAVLGFAYVKRRYTFSADLSVNFAHQPRAIAGAGSRDVVPFGSEKEINIGLFIDLSSVSQVDIDKLGASRVDMYGASMTRGLLGKQSRAWFGLADATLVHWTVTGILGSNYSFLD